MGETPACGFGEGPTAARGKRTRTFRLRNVTQGIGLGRLIWWDCRKSHNNQNHDCTPPQHLLTMPKSHTIWAGHVAGMGEREKCIGSFKLGMYSLKMALSRRNMRKKCWMGSLKMELRKTDGRIRTTFTWIMIGTNGGMLWTRLWNFEFRIMLGIRLFEQISRSFSPWS